MKSKGGGLRDAIFNADDAEQLGAALDAAAEACRRDFDLSDAQLQALTSLRRCVSERVVARFVDAP